MVQRKTRQSRSLNRTDSTQLGMHGRGSQASAPVSDAAGRGDAGGTPQTVRPCCVVPRGNSRIGPTRLKSAPTRQKLAPTRPKSGRLGPYRPYRPVSAKTAEMAESGRNSKKKKKKRCKRTV